MLPASALFDKAGQPAVWVVDAATGTVALEAGDGRRATRPTASIVSGGLAKGDIVVTAGVNRLREGQKVRLAEAACQ